MENWYLLCAICLAVNCIYWVYMSRQYKKGMEYWRSEAVKSTAPTMLYGSHMEYDIAIIKQDIESIKFAMGIEEIKLDVKK